MYTHNNPFVDRLIMQFDRTLRTLAGTPSGTDRANPADKLEEDIRADEDALTDSERLLSGRLMRVNHTGEVCAQALYQGQALTARSAEVRDALTQSALEENDHLNWCETRIKQLGSHTSVLNPLFYFGSFIIGSVAGKIGDRWNLGFVAETEHQVVKHLDKHLQRLPVQDQQSRIILTTMRQDESQHASKALAAGGARLPLPVRLAMKISSRLMTKTTYWI